MTPPAAVLLMARAPRRGQVLRALEPLLGPDGCLQLQATLISRAAVWGRRVAPDALFVAHAPEDAGPELRCLVGPEATLFPQNGEGIAGRLSDATARAFANQAGPMLIVWPRLPRLRREHAGGALDDLLHGCDLVLGPAIDGGLYLLGLARPAPALFAFPEETWRSSDALAIGLAAVRDEGAELGVLRAERPLQRPADVRAALADPMTPPEIAEILRGRHEGRARRSS